MHYRNTDKQDNRATGQRDIGTTRQRDNRTKGQQDNGKMKQRDNWTMGQQGNGKTGQKCKKIKKNMKTGHTEKQTDERTDKTTY